jgi:hypothetical protein
VEADLAGRSKILKEICQPALLPEELWQHDLIEKPSAFSGQLSGKTGTAPPRGVQRREGLWGSF